MSVLVGGLSALNHLALKGNEIKVTGLVTDLDKSNQGKELLQVKYPHTNLPTCAYFVGYPHFSVGYS